MLVKYINHSDSVAVEYGQIYSVISIEKGWYRILTGLEEDYLLPPEAFETVLSTSPLFRDVKYICLDKEEPKYEQLTNGACVFICADHPDEKIQEIAGRLMKNGCREFHFAGIWASEWENVFDGIAVSEHIEDDSDDVVLTMSYDFRDVNFPDDIACTLCSDSSERRVFIFYYDSDTAECYESMGKIFRYVIDNTEDN